jgi:hypothetical protein
MCTKLLGAFAKKHGYNYLRDLLSPLVQQLTVAPSNHSYELDPSKLRPGDDVAENVKNLKHIVQAFLDVICASAGALPPCVPSWNAGFSTDPALFSSELSGIFASTFRLACMSYQRPHLTTTNLFIDLPTGRRASSQLLEASFSWGSGVRNRAERFLADTLERFICPAIVSPETVNIETPRDRTLKRSLILITKVIQNLANNILFGKEQHMVVLNEFLQNNILSVSRFLKDILHFAVSPIFHTAVSLSWLLSQRNRDYSDEDDAEEWLGTACDETDQMILHRFFHHHADKIGKELLSYSGPMVQQQGTESEVSGKQTWDILCAALVEMGAPIEIPRPTRLHSSQHIRYLDFLQRNGVRNMDSVKDIFQETRTPKVWPSHLCYFLIWPDL